MLIYQDLIQVDKILHKLKVYIIKQRQEILRYKEELAACREEIIQLKNRPEPIGDRPSKMVVVGQKSRIDLEKPIEEWGPAYFLKYFQQKYFKKYRSMRKFSSEDWRMNALRVHNFLQRHDDELEKSEYINFIDWLFKKKASKTFVLTVGNIVSDTHFYQWRDLIKSKKFGDFEKTKEQLKENDLVVDTDSLFKDFGV